MSTPKPILHQADVVSVIEHEIETHTHQVDATGHATMVTGTVTVSDTKITATSIIALYAKTLGGTPGALFVSAKTASTSFVIKSTSATDTSDVMYEILAY